MAGGRARGLSSRTAHLLPLPGTGDAALEHVCTGSHDIIVLDLGPRGQSGLETYELTKPFQNPVNGIPRDQMNEQAQTDTALRETLARIEERVCCRLTGLLRNFQLVFRDKGLVLRGKAHTDYAKQLAQHAVMEASSLPIRANEMEVS
jgi:hypothetical protein